MPLVLAIADDPAAAEVLEASLRPNGYEVSFATSGRDGLRLARERHPDLVLLDLMLPDVEGTEICRTLKRDEPTRDIPIIVLTKLDAEIDRIVAFELGSDDYVTKPFSPRELLLRMRAVLRRQPSAEESDGKVEFGRVKLDREAHRVWVDADEVELSLLEFKILSTLCERGPRVQSREELLESVWGIDTSISTRTVDAHVKRLRKKLGPARDCIETVRGVGYRLTRLKRAC